jgi:hypothetical protein
MLIVLTVLRTTVAKVDQTRWAFTSHSPGFQSNLPVMTVKQSAS